MSYWMLQTAPNLPTGIIRVQVLVKTIVANPSRRWGLKSIVFLKIIVFKGRNFRVNLIWQIRIFINFCGNLKVVSATFLLVCFVCLRKSTCETRKNVFYFTSKAPLISEIIKL